MLGRFIPDFGRIVGMMQFSMYHHYTIDEHLLRTVGGAERHRGRAPPGGSSARQTRSLHKIAHRTELYLAAFLHDIAKGRPSDHSHGRRRSRAEALPAASACRRPSTERVAWLVEQHLDHVEHGAGARYFRSAYGGSVGGDRADAGAAQDAAGADRRRHPRGRPRRVERLEGRSSCATSIGRPRSCSAAAIRPSTASPACKRRRKRCARSLPGWSDPEFDAYAQRHYPAYWLKVDARRVRSPTPSCCTPWRPTCARWRLR